MRYGFLLFGTAFGFILSRAGATTYDYYAKLFLFEDLQLMWVIASAAGVGAVGVAVLRKLRAHSLAERQPIDFTPKPFRKGLLVGALVFGAGWGVAGACPGTALAMLGEGKLVALFSIAGMLVGTWVYGLQQSAALRSEPSQLDTRSEAL